MEEVWKDVIDYEGCYQVSNLGRVRSVKKNKYLLPQKRNSGYLIVTFCTHNNPKQLLIHRVVAENFLPNPQKLPEVNHKNGNKKDNRVENLEWTTRSKNERHAYVLGLKSHVGEKNTQAVLTREMVFEIKKMWSTKKYFQKEIGKKFGISQQTVSSIITGKNWGHL